MNNDNQTFKQSMLRTAVRSALAFGVVAGLGVSPVYAANEDAEATEEGNKVLVTGSRIRRNEFASPSPIQVLTIEEAKKSGITSVAQMLQRMSLSNGQQFDSTFNSNAGNSNATEAPPTGGVGSSNIGLRGLGPERTLILLNGRRLGASGVRGAPAQPDISLIPFEMVDRIEVLSDSASAIYGADAVAGVVNVILKDKIEGMQLTATISKPLDDGGEIRQFSFATGLETERSTFVLGVEFYDRKRIATGDRLDCMEGRFRDEADGSIYHYCRSGFWDNTAIPFGSVSNPVPGTWAHYTPGQSDLTNPLTGQPIANWSSPLGLPAPSSFPCYGGCELDDNGDPFRFYSYSPFTNDQKERLRADLVQPVTRFSVVGRGTYIPEWGEDTNTEIYYETNFFHRHLTNTAAAEQMFVAVDGQIPQEDANGELLRDGTGALQLFANPLNPFGVTALNIITFDDLNQTRDVELDQFRAVVGMQGDLDMEWAKQKGWNWDISASYDRGAGVASQPQMNEDRLALALDTQRLDVDGNVICGVNLRSNAGQGFITPAECVPFQAFAPSLYNNQGSLSGTFATDAERDYLMGERVNHTTVEQIMYQATITGELFDFESGGAASIAIGAEYRSDKIRSRADFVSARGAQAAENPSTEGPTTGTRNVKEVYAEVNLPILQGIDGVESLEIDLAARYTDESNFGSENTERVRITYAPVDWITLSAAYGTSFRAPNLREQFLGDQFDGTSGASDPCHVTNAGPLGWDGITYDPTQDIRTASELANCIQQGADPTILGSMGTTTIPVRIGGNVSDLLPETSEQTTFTLKAAPYDDGKFSFDFAITYFDIEIDNTIRSIDAGVILNRCIRDAPNLESPFCSRVERNQNPVPGTEQLNFPTAVDASFINIGLETSSGWDINTRMAYNFGEMELTWTTQWTIQDERSEKIFEEDEVHDLVGEFGTPKNRFLNSLTLTQGDFQYNLISRFIDNTKIGRDADLSADCFTPAASNRLVGSPMLTVVCSAESQWIHDASVVWTASDSVQLTFGVANVLDEEPPLVNPSAGSNRAGRVVSSGYDQVGRAIFANASYKF